MDPYYEERRMMRRLTHHGRRGDRFGAVVVEVAFCLPVLLLFFFGALEFSRVNMIRQTVENAVYEGSRRGVVPGATADDCRNVATAILNSVAVNGADVDVIPADLSDASDDVTVSIDVPINVNSWVMPFFFRDRTISGTMTLRKERFSNARTP